MAVPITPVTRPEAPVADHPDPIGLATDDPPRIDGSSRDVFDPTDGVLHRPVLVPTLAERLASVRTAALDRVADGAGRILVVVVVLVTVGAGLWWLLRPPPAPAEAGLPLASPGGSAGAPGRGGRGDSSAGDSPGGQPGHAETGAAGASGAEATTTTRPAALVVYVAGAVVHPGVYRLDAGRRVADALGAAGGTTPQADGERLNLAAPLQDGQRVYVPRHGEEVPALAEPALPPAPTGSVGGTKPGGPPAAPVNLNEAPESELETLTGVGPATAAAIVAYRTTNGPFRSVEDLLEVRGIGDAKLAALRDQVTV
jgi:competence protein ComEA